MEIESLAGAMEGCSLEATCPKFQKYNQIFYNVSKIFEKCKYSSMESQVIALEVY